MGQTGCSLPLLGAGVELGDLTPLIIVTLPVGHHYSSGDGAVIFMSAMPLINVRFLVHAHLATI